MDVAVCVIAEDTIISRSGNLSIINIIEQITVQELPAQPPKMVLVVSLRGDRGESGLVSAELVHSDGDSILNIGEAPLDPDKVAPPDAKLVVHNLVVELNNAPLPKHGMYTFNVSLDGKIICHTPLQVTLKT